MSDFAAGSPANRPQPQPGINPNEARFQAPTDEPLLLRWSLIAIAAFFLILLVFAPLTAVFAEALSKGWGAAVKSLQSREAISAIKLTLLVAAIVVPLNAVFGIAAAWFITKFDFRGKAFLITLIDLPFSVSPVVAGLCIVLLFGANTAIGAWLVANGFPIVFALPGIVLATVFVTFPFVARELIPVMIEQGRAEEEAALTLGASGWRTFFTVTLPNIRWALLYGLLLCNARAMGEFGAVAVVSGKRESATTMPLRIEMFYNEYLSVAAFSLAGLLAFFALLTLLLKTWLESRHADALSASRRGH
ncbi:sulfate ABC transporter permease subunit CysW [Xinfangfangia sp. D13-10-4-6]|uniref:sulfate ABC transporter permease subunit CysW n=1 Tax=Pseudogemmobacter hezensis TaxID=2737662 RepID=UPI001555C4C1|nr:sulfate ABC transporter permease subunit CysW [Pseudogemmobacter hezensis]NPD17351.1 sulfate ABC transporter permease subunit CysW [Pseudogemmobacter hezensis]